MQPLFNFHGNAVLSSLLFLGAAAAGLGVIALVAFFWYTKRAVWARRTLVVGVAGGVTYVALLLGASLGSREQVVAPGNEKYFCEVDCHQAIGVTAVERAQTLGPAGMEASAQGEFVVVTLRVWFDPDTISRRRPLDIPLNPDPKSIAIVDASGRHYRPSSEGQLALEAVSGAQPSLVEPIKPGQSYTTRIVFDLPPDVLRPRLLIAETAPETRLLIGHENSFLHAKTVFRLPEPAPPSTQSSLGLEVR